MIERGQRRIEPKPPFGSVKRRIFDNARDHVRPAPVRLLLAPPLDRGEIRYVMRIRKQPDGAFMSAGVRNVRRIGRAPVEDRSELQCGRRGFEMDRDARSDRLDRTGTTSHAQSLSVGISPESDRDRPIETSHVRAVRTR